MNDKVTRTLNILENSGVIFSIGLTEAFGDLMGSMMGAIGESLSKGEISQEEILDNIRKNSPDKLIKEIDNCKKKFKEQAIQNKAMLEKVLTDEVCDTAISIIEKYKIPLPAIDRELNTEEIAGYVQFMIVKEGPGLKIGEQVGDMIKELMDTLNPLLASAMGNEKKVE